MKYFLHDTNSFDDEKITELFLNFGYEGVGLFYTLLEKIAKQEKPIKTVVLKSQLRIGKRLEKCWCFMESIGLIISEDGETFNEQLLNYSEKYQIKKEKTRIKVSEWRDKQVNKINVTGYNHDSNTIKVKESKEKNKKVNNNSGGFLLFWESYPKKVGKIDAERAWNKAKDKPDIETILKSIADHIKSDQWQKDNGQFIPNPATFINQGRWFDEFKKSGIIRPAFQQ